VPPLELRSHPSAVELGRTFQPSDICCDYPDIRTVIHTRLAALPLRYFKPGRFAANANVADRFIATVLSRLLFPAEFLETWIGAQRVPDRCFLERPATVWTGRDYSGSGLHLLG
jgi:hypothetical protein